MTNEHVKAVVTGNNRMIGQLYPEIAPPNKNLVFSPFSLHTILSLVYQGSAGATQDAFEKVLNIPDKLKTAEGYASVMSELNSVKDVTLEIANRVYVMNGYEMKPNFLEVATKQFAAGAENINFAQPTAAQTMNTWVESKTNSKIKDLINKNDLNQLTRMVLINAIYFKGNWADQFKKKNTRPDKFYISETETVVCDMMFRNGKYRYKDDVSLDAQVIEMPYKNRNLSMIIVLPRSRTGICDLEKKMADLDMSTLTSDMYSREVDLRVPKFKIESTLELNEPLKQIGLAHAFSSEANFSELLTSSEDLMITKVVQKAFIEVNEEGAEAAAATGVVIKSRCLERNVRKAVFRADHPFIFYLAHVANNGGRHVFFYGKLDET